MNEAVIKQGEEVKLLEQAYNIRKRNLNVNKENVQTKFNHADSWSQNASVKKE